MSFFGCFFKKEKKGGEAEVNSKQSQRLSYRKGSFIGQKCEVYVELGHGGFGIVHLVYSRETKAVYALKTFKELRTDLEPLLRRQTGEIIKPPELIELEAWELVNKGVSLGSLGRSEEAIPCYDKALKIDPQDTVAWNNKGLAEEKLGCVSDAVISFRKVIELALDQYKSYAEAARQRLQKLEE